MNTITLGQSDLNVSTICLGSMTWGTQNNQQDADEQIDFALAKGINFIDTAEMYAIPPSAETYGKTETMIGHWLAKNSERRKEIILATKIAGNGLAWIREGGDITGEAILTSVDASLKRLQTDYIDLYQLHWPNRTSPHFSKDWPYLMENCVHAGIAYLPWSPLAGGVLSGKYLDGVRPEGSRWSKSQRNGLFRDNATVNTAVNHYIQIAQKYDLTPAQLALAWCHQVDGVSSTIIGATSAAQLKEDVAAFEISLSAAVLDDINSVLRQYPLPF